MSALTIVAENEVVSGSKFEVSSFSRKSVKESPQYLARLVEAADLFGRAMSGNRRAMIDLQEAFSTSDFPILFADILSRELLPSYQEAPQIWSQFATRTVVRDFRPHRLLDLLGGQGILELVPELTEYPARGLEETEYELLVRKHGSRFSISWEAMVNDDLGGLSTLPNRLGVAARRSEDYDATDALVDDTGPDPDFFNVTNGNLFTGDPALTVDSLSEGLDIVNSRLDPDGAPVIINGLILMVPPALETAAQKILGATEIRITDGSGTEIIVGNYLTSRVRLVVNPWLTAIDTSGAAATTWYLLPEPNGPRPAVALGFLMGNETPDLRVRSSDSQRVGGGDVPPGEGGFDIDDIQYRVRHVYGSATLDPFTTLVSLGTTP